MKTMTDVVDQIDTKIDSIIVMDDYDGGYVAGLRAAKCIVEATIENGPIYFKPNNNTPMN